MKKNKKSQAAQELVLKDDHQCYAHVTKMLGNGRLMARCDDGKERVCKIRGSMHRRVWISVGDIVLISLREFGGDGEDDGKGDVIFKYTENHVKTLSRSGEYRAKPDEADQDQDLVFEDEGNAGDEDRDWIAVL